MGLIPSVVREFQKGYWSDIWNKIILLMYLYNLILDAMNTRVGPLPGENAVATK
jgi:hypothetical protein